MYCILINVPTWSHGKRKRNDRSRDKYEERERYSTEDDDNKRSDIAISTTSNVTAGNILPGASTLEDINKYINAAKKVKIDQLKKKMSSQR